MQHEPDSPEEVIAVRGARMHNLKNVDVDIPRNRLVVLTGPSGSGKSSLAFDTLFAEGQRQYLESLSVYARQFLHQMERPEVDSIEGLQPTICIDQRPGNANPRSTVATVTEIYDYLRVLMARLGQPSCHRCGEPIEQQAPEEIVESLLRLPEGTKTMLLAPLVRGRRGSQEDALARIRKAGLVRVRIDGQVFELDAAPEIDPNRSHEIEAVVDRIVLRAGVESRLSESVRLALHHGEGVLIACSMSGGGSAKSDWQDRLFSTRFACPRCDLSVEEIEPRTFSFNSPYGACPRCEGLGSLEQFDPELLLPDLNLSLAAGGVRAWSGQSAAALKKVRLQLAEFLLDRGRTWDSPLNSFSSDDRETLLKGDAGGFLGVLTMLEKEFATATDDERREQLASFRGQVECPACGGSRLRPEANSVRLDGRNIHEICKLTIAAARDFFAGLQVAEDRRPIFDPLVAEIRKRLEFLAKVDVDYLTLHRAADTLSGGELQRVRLASSIGSGLVGVCYVLDEPSIGLHPRDNQRLIDALRDLQQRGNTVLVVEHDAAVMQQADFLIDIGPGAGPDGGRVVAQGTPREVMNNDASLTGRYLSGQASIAIPATRRRLSKARSIVLEGVATHNLKTIDARFPLGGFVCVTGVSGSGKSSLVNETLAYALRRELGGVAPKPGPYRRLRGANQIDKIVQIDQAAIGRSSRSTPATYVGVFDEIRRVFASTRDAKQRGFSASRFSFNAKGGRCEECQGHGTRRIAMNFLPDLFVTCESCGGRRFNPQTLAVRFHGRSIADVLQMPIATATEFFANFAAIVRPLQCLCDVGLGYLGLGQPATTLSGGEAQRIKLATELARVDTGQTLYLLDEPTTGLHFDDIRRLLDVLQRLVDRGNSVIVIEHHLDVIKSADWIIDLGPEGGHAGGEIIFEGTPEELAGLPENPTGRFLRPLLERD